MLSHDVDLTEVQSKLKGWIEEKMPLASDVFLSDMERPSAGFTNVSISFRLRWSEGGKQKSQDLFFRGAGKSDPVYPDFKLEKQFRVMKCLEGTNVPVPEVYWMEKDEDLFGFQFYIMEKLNGVVPSEFPPYHSFGICYDATPEQRAKMWWNTIEAMVGIHKLDWEKLKLSFLGVSNEKVGPQEQELDYWDMYLNWAKEEPQPVLEATFDWLKKNRYHLERVSLCWGDARLPNTMFTPDGRVRAILDWDMATLGDPVSDLAFIISLDWLLSEGTEVPRLEGFPGKEETIQRYEELTGWKVSNFFYNEVYATFRAAAVILKVQKNLLKMGIQLPGDDPIVDNFCTRRLADMLDLPKPDALRAKTKKDENVNGTVQFLITGPGGEKWYIEAREGTAIRHDGIVESPDVTVTASADDWNAIIGGRLDRFNAWTSGKLKIKGNTNLYQKLEGAISQFLDTRL